MATPKAAFNPAHQHEASTNLFSSLVHSVTTPSINLFLTAICIGLVYLIYKSAQDKRDTKCEVKKELKPFPRGDMTLDELKKYDGKNNDEGRILLAVNREIYDVTKGARFYGPDGPYAPLAGNDATRSLALFSVNAIKEGWDDYSDLNVSQMNTVAEWLEQFKEKYDYVGRLVKTEAEKSTPVEPTDEEPDDSDLSSPLSTPKE